MLYQVKKILLKRNFLRQFFRYTHNDQKNLKILYPLENRTLLRVTGPDAQVFLQGLITNDMGHFNDGTKSMYAMLLNNKGRVLYDTLIHKCENEDTYLLECDKCAIDQLHKHLKLFLLRRKVAIGHADQDYKLWALIAPPNTITKSDNESKNYIHVHKDPRLPNLGYRILSSPSVTQSNMTEIVGNDTLIENTDKGYKQLRYELGVSEGTEDLPPGSNFPLEANCDYLHGVSFHKGCYIGQELTARVHHTGVVRKRIMPLLIKGDAEDLPADSVISVSDKPKSNVGKLRGYVGRFGIGLVRIKEAMEAQALLMGKYPVEVIKPSWWPIEAPKEKVTINKLESLVE